MTAISISLVLLIIVVFVGDRLIRAHSVRVRTAFLDEAESVLQVLSTELRQYERIVRRAADGLIGGQPPEQALPDTTRYPEIVGLGFVEAGRTTDGGYDIGKPVPQNLRNVVRLDHGGAQSTAARDSAESGKIVMTAKRGKEPLLLFYPVYRSPSVAAKESKGDLQGWVVLAFRPEEFFRRRLSSLQSLDVELFDGEITPSALLADSQPKALLSTSPKRPTMRYVIGLGVFGREWRLNVWPRARFELGTRAPVIVLAIASFVLAVLAWSVVLIRRRSFELGTRMLDSFADVIAVVDRQGRVLFATPSAGRVLGPSSDDLIGTNLLESIHPEDVSSLRSALQDVLRSEDSHKFASVRFAVRDGTWRELDGSIQPIAVKKDSPHALIVAQDVTDVRALEHQVSRTARMESLGSVAAKVAHEFNNVLMGVRTNLEVMRRRYPQEGQIQTICESMQGSLSRGGKIASEILRFARPAGVNEAPIDVQRWMKELESELRPLLPPQIKLDVETPHEPVVLLGDAGQLSQVIVNLVLNARDALKQGGNVLCVAERSEGGRFSFGVVPAGEFAHLRVRDTGEGMPPEVLQHVFEPLFTTKHTGTGLGLAVSYQIVSAHRGFIFAESTLGEGSDFHVFLPALPSQTVMQEGA